MIATIAMIGASITMRRSITIVIWICVISFVERVIREDGVKWFTCADESCMTREKRHARRSRAMVAARREARYPAAAAAATEPKQSANMEPAMLARYPMSPPAAWTMPTFTISAM